MLMKILFTLGSARRISNAFLTVSGVAPLNTWYEYYPKRRNERIPSDIQEVGGLTAVQRKDIHRGHRQASSVDETANVAIKFDKVQVRLLCLNLGRLLLRDVTEVENIFLAELGVIVKAELGVHTAK
jgi:hypothetical protein